MKTIATQNITELYETVLLREPDPKGLKYWVQKNINGMPIEEIKNSFMKTIAKQNITENNPDYKYVNTMKKWDCGPGYESIHNHNDCHKAAQFLGKNGASNASSTNSKGNYCVFGPNHSVDYSNHKPRDPPLCMKTD